jgi:hypothetical protein
VWSRHSGASIPSARHSSPEVFEDLLIFGRFSVRGSAERSWPGNQRAAQTDCAFLR